MQEDGGEVWTQHGFSVAPGEGGIAWSPVRAQSGGRSGDASLGATVRGKTFI